MEAIIQTEPGNHLSLKIGEVEKPTPKYRELLIKVHYATLNRLDLLQAKATNPVLPVGASSIIGVEVSGVVEEISLDSESNFQVGDRVMALLLGGGYAQYVTVDERTVFKVPDEISLSIAAAIPEAFITAYKLLFTVGNLKSGETVLIHAAASSIGQAAIQMDLLNNIKVITTYRTTAKTAITLEYGAHVGVTVNESKLFAKEIIDLNDGNRVDVVLDPVCSDYINEDIEVLAVDGRWILYGMMSGGAIQDPNLLGKLMGKRISLLPTTLRTRSIEYKENIVKQLKEVDFGMKAIFDGRIKIKIDAIYAWNNVLDAHNLMSRNENIGKILLKVFEPENLN